MQHARFEELGSIQFELACRTLLELESGFTSEEWRELPAGASAFSQEGLLVPGAERRLPGPTLVVVSWERQAAKRGVDLQAAVDQALADWAATRPASLLVLSNAPIAPDPPGIETAHVGPAELTRLVLASPALRLGVPAVLGICPPGELVPAEMRARSSANVDAALALAHVFVATRAYARARETLERHGFVVLTGAPEMGKTAIARTIGLGLMTSGWELHECTDPAELWAAYARGRRQVFVADDAFGSTEYRPDAAERWALQLDRTLRAMDGSHRLIWTSRPAPLKAALRHIHATHGVERFPAPAEVQVDAAQLDVVEKALILFRHAKAARLEQPAIELVRDEGWRIVSHEHFTPERIRRFASARLPQLALDAPEPALVALAVREELREPTAAMAASFHALAAEYRSVLVALLDTPPGAVGERELVAAVRRHGPAGAARVPAELVERLTDHFLHVAPGGIEWVHPSWRDLVIDELVADREARRAFLRACSLDGLLLALSVGGGRAGERALPLLVEDADWDELSDRVATLAPSLDGPEVTRLLRTLADTRLEAPHDELDALAAYALALLARRWRQEQAVVPVGLLDVWFALAAELPERPAALELGTTWIELVPTETEVPDPEDAAELARWDEWTVLVELLSENQPDALVRFGFPERQAVAIGAFVATVQFALGSLRASPHRDLVAEILQRLDRIAPWHSMGARTLATALGLPARRLVADKPPPRRRLSRELRQLLETPLAPRPDRALVERVLRDL